MQCYAGDLREACFEARRQFDRSLVDIGRVDFAQPARRPRPAMDERPGEWPMLIAFGAVGEGEAIVSEVIIARITSATESARQALELRAPGFASRVPS